MSFVLHFFFPFLSWVKEYSVASLKKDAAAGLTVALVLVPQSMANAQLAGLPAWHGLYAALLPALVGGFWGSSRQMVTGTVAVISLMAAAALEPLAITGPEGYIAAMALLTLLVGALQLTCGLLRLGIVVNFLSLPVLCGFTNAAALIIAASQLPKLFGVSVDSAGRQYETVLRTLDSALNYTHLPSLLLALSALAVIWICARFAPKVPAVLVAVALTIFLSWALDFSRDSEGKIQDVASEEVQVLLLRLKQLDDESKILNHALAILASRPAPSKVAELENAFHMQEQRLLNDRIQRQAGLVREHLRRCTFVAEETPDGRRIFHLKQDSGYLSGNTSEEAAEIRPTSPAAPKLAPDGERLDGRTWRLKLAGGTPDLAALHFSAGGEVVGSIPSGLPRLGLPDFSLGTLLLLLPQAVIIAFVGFAESISIAKAAASRQGYRIDPNQELVGQGLANISGGLTATCPVSGSFSNSALNLNSGAVTGVSCLFVSLGALIVLQFFTGALYHLPQPVLAVVVMRATASLINIGEFRRIWAARRFDGLIALVTFAATLFFAPHLDWGIAVGVVISLAAFFFRSMYPQITALTCGPDGTLCDMALHRRTECRHIALVHFQGPLFFANSVLLEDHVIRLIESRKELRHIHMVCSGITHMDASGEESLAMLVQRAGKAGIEMSFSGVMGSVAQVMGRTGILASVGLQNIFLTPREAVCAIHKRVRHDADCTECPLAQLFCLPKKGSCMGNPDEPEDPVEEGSAERLENK